MKLTTLATCGWCLRDQTGGWTESAKRFQETFICNESLPSHTGARFCSADHQMMASKDAAFGGNLDMGRHKDNFGVEVTELSTILGFVSVRTIKGRSIDKQHTLSPECSASGARLSKMV